jgi:hypothetical protein
MHIDLRHAGARHQVVALNHDLAGPVVDGGAQNGRRRRGRGLLLRMGRVRQRENRGQGRRPLPAEDWFDSSRRVYGSRTLFSCPLRRNSRAVFPRGKRLRFSC